MTTWIKKRTADLKREWGLFVAEDRGRFRFCMLVSLLLGFAAHGFAFLNTNYSHDSVKCFAADLEEEYWKLVLGRIFVPIYRVVRGWVSAPWLIGVLSLIWIGLAVYLVVRIFELRSKWAMGITAGIMAVNVTVSATAATFLYELDFDMFALLLAVAAVFFWNRGGLWNYVISGVLTMGVLGLYQSYLAVIITLIMLLSLKGLTEKQNVSDVLKNGVIAMGAICCSAVVYWILLQILLRKTGLSLDMADYNSLNNINGIFSDGLCPRLIGVYTDWSQYYLSPSCFFARGMIALNLLVLTIDSAVLVCGFSRRGITWPARILGLVLVILLPLGMNIACLGMGMSHALMQYAFGFCYLMPLFFADEVLSHLKWMRGLACVLAGMMLFSGIQTANALYLKKDMEAAVTASVMTRVAERMDQTEGYVAGETPVVFVGSQAPAGIVKGFERYEEINGIKNTMATTYYGTFSAFFYNQLGEPIVLADYDLWCEIGEKNEILETPVFPAQGSVFFYDGVLIVHLPE